MMMAYALRVLDRKVFGRRVALGAMAPSMAANDVGARVERATAHVIAVSEETEWRHAIARAKHATAHVVAAYIPRRDPSVPPAALVLARTRYLATIGGTVRDVERATLAPVTHFRAARVASDRAFATHRAAALTAPSRASSPLSLAQRYTIAARILSSVTR